MEVDDMTDLQLYEAIYDRKWVRGYTWKRVSETLGLDLEVDTIFIRYKRLAKRLHLPFKPEKLKELKQNPSKAIIIPTSSQSSNQTRKVKSIGNMTDLEIHRTKYGELPPTLLISELGNDDWIDKYMEYDYFTDEEELITELKKEWRTDYLIDLREKIWSMEELVALIPRGYGKTESVLALFIRWILEIRQPLYVVTPASNHSKNMLKRIERQLKSPRIRRDYGDILNKVSYDKEMMTIEYHPSFNYTTFDSPLALVTFNGAKEGVHPAWIHFEDVMQKEYKNIESNQDIRDKFTKTFSKMRTRRGDKRTKITATGTRYGLDDFYSYLMNDQSMPFVHYKALEEDNITWLRCPNYTLVDLIGEKLKDAASFETSMNNNPVPSSGLYFEREHWIEVGVNDIPYYTNMTYYIVVDPARGMSEGADNTAILVVGISNGVAYVVNGFIGKIDDDEKVKRITDLHTQYNPAFTLIEKVFAQIDMRKFAHLRGIQGYQDTSRNAKIVRISAMKSYFKDGLIKVVRDIQPYEFILNEYLQYQESHSTTSRKDDAIDALSIFIQQYGRLLDIYDDDSDDWSTIPAHHFHLQGNGY